MHPHFVKLAVSSLEFVLELLKDEIMFKVSDAKGKPLAEYANESEALTYVSASFPGSTLSEIGEVRSGEVTVFNADDDEVATITGPFVRDTNLTEKPASDTGGSTRSSKGTKGKGKK